MENQAEIIQKTLEVKANIGGYTFYGFGAGAFFSEHYQLIMGLIALAGFSVNWYYSREAKKINLARLNLDKDKIIEEHTDMQQAKFKAAGMNEAAKMVKQLRDNRAA